MSEEKDSPQRRSHELAATILTFLGLAVFFGAFGVIALYETGDWIGFVAGLPFVLATVGVVGSWMTMIRRDASTEAVHERKQRTISNPRPAA
jgi:hypothetical protein